MDQIIEQSLTQSERDILQGKENTKDTVRRIKIETRSEV